MALPVAGLIESSVVVVAVVMVASCVHVQGDRAF